MTTQQSIPFKLRKKTHVKYKEIDENDDVSNIMNGAVKQKQLKRHIKDDIKKDGKYCNTMCNIHFILNIEVMFCL